MNNIYAVNSCRLINKKVKIANTAQHSTTQCNTVQHSDIDNSKIGYALSLGLKEKEIFFFGLMQWIFVLLAYILWLQMLSWIPQPVWDGIQECIDSGQDNCTVLADIPLGMWGWFCILVAAFPIGIFSSAMGTTHFLHKQKHFKLI